MAALSHCTVVAAAEKGSVRWLWVNVRYRAAKWANEGGFGFKLRRRMLVMAFHPGRPVGSASRKPAGATESPQSQPCYARR
ncbi:hypothetical protein MES5069_350012 [Mesorhizobium escarrei]|uniref:Transposase n=1 Tax=Mesorhizobium escarrei TaxID=666018 RepID=A0ABM9E0W5_9HYPH|nr:hypothetical protein MES5069_350012 [Mesorhizobium escarrei]